MEAYRNHGFDGENGRMEEEVGSDLKIMIMC